MLNISLLLILAACDNKKSFDNQLSAANIVENTHAKNKLTQILPIIVFNKADVDNDSIFIGKNLRGKAYELTTVFKQGRYNHLNYNYFKVLATKNNISYSMNLSAFQSNRKNLISKTFVNKDTTSFVINKYALTTSYHQKRLVYELTFFLRNHFMKGGISYDTIMINRVFLYAAPK
ncbi:hypothetical protein [Hymenobacter ginsengisoli]